MARSSSTCGTCELQRLKKVERKTKLGSNRDLRESTHQWRCLGGRHDFPDRTERPSIVSTWSLNLSFPRTRQVLVVFRTSSSSSGADVTFQMSINFVRQVNDLSMPFASLLNRGSTPFPSKTRHVPFWRQFYFSILQARH
jgi:hypothetical protein